MEVITLLKQHIFQTYNQLHHRAHNVITVCHVALLSEIWRSKDISRLPAWCVIEQVYTGHSLWQHIQYVGCQTRYIIGNGKSLLRVYRASKNVFTCTRLIYQVRQFSPSPFFTKKHII